MGLLVCIDPEHAKASVDHATQRLTIHEGKWAVCPAGRADGHSWAETNRLAYDDLFRKRVAEKRGVAPG